MLGISLVISYSFIQLLQVDIVSHGSYCISKLCFMNKLDNPDVAFFNLPKGPLLPIEKNNIENCQEISKSEDTINSSNDNKLDSWENKSCYGGQGSDGGDARFEGKSSTKSRLCYLIKESKHFPSKDAHTLLTNELKSAFVSKYSRRYADDMKQLRMNWYYPSPKGYRKAALALNLPIP
ncbi:hypothetical protein FQA39_LY00987 [Lamprigera yunnana]|nr:hypothetical protein FQA39_LY00987 [Lamprigera yunnana]